MAKDQIVHKNFNTTCVCVWYCGIGILLKLNKKEEKKIKVYQKKIKKLKSLLTSLVTNNRRTLMYWLALGTWRLSHEYVIPRLIFKKKCIILNKKTDMHVAFMHEKKRGEINELCL